MKHLATLSFLLLIAPPCFHAGTVATPTPVPIAVKFLDLFDQLRAAQNRAPDHNNHVAFRLSENDINEYMRYSLKTTPRPGLEAVTIKLFSKDYISTFTQIDLDAVERWRPGTIPAILRPLLKGKKTLWIDCRIHAYDSSLTFNVEKARFEDVPLPALFVNKVIQIMAARQPEKYDTSKPIPMPFGLRKVWTGDRVIYGNN